MPLDLNFKDVSFHLFIYLYSRERIKLVGVKRGEGGSTAGLWSYVTVRSHQGEWGSEEMGIKRMHISLRGGRGGRFNPLVCLTFFWSIAGTADFFYT